MMQVEKVGRKWIHGNNVDEQRGGKWKCDIEINSHSKGWKAGQVVEFEGTMKKESSRFGTKITIFPGTQEEAEERTLKQQEAKQREQAIKGAHTMMMYVRSAAREGRIYHNGIHVVKNSPVYEEYKEEIEQLIAQAQEIKAQEDIKKEELRQKRKAEREAVRAAKESHYKYIPSDHYVAAGSLIYDDSDTTWYVVLSYLRQDDAMCFGIFTDDDTYYSLKCRKATGTEYAEPEAKRLKAEAKQAEGQERARKIGEVEKVLQAIAQDIRENGEYPEGRTDLRSYTYLYDTQDIYGGGAYFVITETHIWYVKNNGRDGDDWSLNNVITGGAGGIGHRIPKQQDIVDRLTELEERYTHLNEMV